MPFPIVDSTPQATTHATGTFNVHLDAIAWSDEGWIGQDPIEHVPPSTAYVGTTI